MNSLVVKATVRERDGQRCTKCGMTHEKHLERYGRSLEVHRLTPGSAYTVEGCVTLCIPCHGPEPRRPSGQRFKDEPGTLHRVSLGAWGAVVEELARRRNMTPTQLIISLVSQEAERVQLGDLPSTPWEAESN